MSRSLSALFVLLSLIAGLVERAAAQDPGCPYGGPCSAEYSDYDYNLYDYDYSDLFNPVDEAPPAATSEVEQAATAATFDTYECDEFYAECECFDACWPMGAFAASPEPEEVVEEASAEETLITGYDPAYDEAMCGPPVADAEEEVASVDVVDSLFPEYDCFYGCFNDTSLDAGGCAEQNTATLPEEETDPFMFPVEEAQAALDEIVEATEPTADEWWVWEGPIAAWDCEGATCHTTDAQPEEDCEALHEAAALLDGMAIALQRVAQSLRDLATDNAVEIGRSAESTQR